MIIDKLNAVSANPSGRPVYIPGNINPRALVGVLGQLGLMIPAAVSAGVGSNNLRASGHRFPVKELDDALNKANIPTTDRFRLKMAMTDNGILAD
jgi:hypothetical protein